MQNNNTSLPAAILISLILSLGIIAAGFFVGKGFYSSRNNQPYITVKGLAERVVKADLAVWTISFSAIGNDITTTNNELFRQQAIVMNFVKNHGFKDQEISLDQIKLTDRYAADFQSTTQPTSRYLMKGAIKIRSTNVDHVRQASQTTGDLVKEGITLGSESDDGSSNPAFYFTQLNSIRPVMLSDATKSAYNVAFQFAKDARSKLGTIRRANQGLFEITSPDETFVDPNNAWQARRAEQTSIYKKIRLVSTLEYFLVKG